MNDQEKKEILETYSWIKVQKHKDEESLSWEERYKSLEKHHVEETNFLVSTVRDIVRKYC